MGSIPASSWAWHWSRWLTAAWDHRPSSGSIWLHSSENR
jgi:hypothetical protein